MPDADRDQIRQLLEDWARHGALQVLSIVALGDVAKAHCSIQRGATHPGEKALPDLVHATFCLEKVDGAWQMVHQQLSKPFRPSGRLPG